jgi:hypothetical protein
MQSWRAAAKAALPSFLPHTGHGNRRAEALAKWTVRHYVLSVRGPGKNRASPFRAAGLHEGPNKKKWQVQ